MSTPELGQLLFSNGDMHEYDLQNYIEAGLVLIAETIAEQRGEDPQNRTLVDNSGEEPYIGDVFTMTAYCWCDGYGDHEDGCPPNFSHAASGLQVSWYKHVGRSATQNLMVTRKQWAEMVTECLAEVTQPNPDRPAGAGAGGA